MYLVLMALCSYIHKYTHLHHCLQFFLYLCGLLLKGPTTRRLWILSKYCFRGGAGTPRSTPSTTATTLRPLKTAHEDATLCVWRTGPSPHHHHLKLHARTHARTRESSLCKKAAHTHSWMCTADTNNTQRVQRGELISAWFSSLGAAPQHEHNQIGWLH